jgi:hypothetical protein
MHGRTIVLPIRARRQNAPLKSSTVTQGLSHHFVPVFANVSSPLPFLFHKLLNDLHINTVSLQQGYSKDFAIYINEYGKYETNMFGMIQHFKQSPKHYSYFSLTEHFAHNNQL